MSTAVFTRPMYLVASLATALAIAFATIVWLPAAGAQEAAGFDGFIQSGNCDAPSDEVRVDLESEEDFDVMPYLAKLHGGEGTATLAYYGAPESPGFGFPVIFTDEDFSLVITEGGTDTAVACGNLLEPDDDLFEEAGLALVRLHSVGGSGVEGVAIVERTVVQREDDVISTRVRIMLLTDVSAGAEPAASPEATPVA